MNRMEEVVAEIDKIMVNLENISNLKISDQHKTVRSAYAMLDRFKSYIEDGEFIEMSTFKTIRVKK